MKHLRMWITHAIIVTDHLIKILVQIFYEFNSVGRTLHFVCKELKFEFRSKLSVIIFEWSKSHTICNCVNQFNE
jgi:hypothetical protein